jgi:conjugal transfer pilus assembly protein TraB
MRERLLATYERLSPRQRQWLTVAVLCLGVFGVFYLIFTVSDKTGSLATGPQANLPGAQKTTLTNVMPAGQQVDARDRWVGEAGKKLAEHEADRATQDQFNKQVLSRFETLEKQLTQTAQPKSLSAPQAGLGPASPAPDWFPPQSALSSPANLAAQPPAPKTFPSGGMPAGPPPTNAFLIDAPAVGLVRISMQPPNTAQAAPNAPGSATGGPGKSANDAKGQSANDYLPVSFTRAVLLGGLDAPTGGQSQTNPQPVLLRLEDNAVLPNRFRSQVRECFVVAAGYGDISSERAYMRTENLSCIRNDGSALEVKIQGSVFGEDGKVGVRGRLVEKQGQLLARALVAGIASGIGQAFGTGLTTVSVSPLGSTQTVDSNKVLEYGAYVGVGKALDRLAQYYIKMAETIFPVIEVDAGRQVDVVITKGVVIDAPVNGAANRPVMAPRFDPQVGQQRFTTVSNDEDN